MAKRTSELGPLIGRWRITEMDEWDSDAIDLIEPGFIEFDAEGTGQLVFIAVEGGLDCRPVMWDGRVGIEFTWEGVDDCDHASGRGWARLTDDHTLEGHVYFHLGMNSGFHAEPFGSTTRPTT